MPLLRSKTRHPDLTAGLLSGLIGGIAASGAKMLGEAIYPPRIRGQQPPPVVLVEKLAGRPFRNRQRELATQSIHWTFGALLGAIYGAAAEIAPVVTTGQGAAFGLAVLALTHESTLPALGLNEPPQKQPREEQLSEIFTHTLYGLTAETVRRAVRPLL
jgi:putative membrane protein